ncbi:threonine/serine ThrE exporter family protein [Pseudoalteromonas denitrificans]|uniref:threonine/serine ThrE exporter family protein n=1 Tax=Pseudoalteromonas denitrificans TaxID=43656 RepID=UPI000B83CB04|nr:threonine/serine exporter family protein [Pseudoalteromonas denitrificans]
MNNATFTQKRKFIVKLGKMLHKYGTPAYRLEAHLLNVAKSFGLRASFIITPTALTFVIWTEGHENEYTHAARVEPGELDLGSLSRTDELVDELSNGTRTLSEADERLDYINDLPNPYNRIATGIAFSMSGGAFAMLMGTSWNDAFWSACLSLIVYIFVLWSERSKGVAHMLEPLVAVVAALLACAISTYLDPSINIRLVILSAIIVFIPGLALTLGLAELSARHLVSGTARVMDAIMLLFKLYFGAFLGMAIGFALFGQTEFIPPQPLEKWTSLIAIAVLCSSLIVIFKTKAKHATWSIVSGFIAFGSSYLGGIYLDFTLGAFVGAFAVGIYSNLFTRIKNAPACIVSMQGLIVLVPGSKTYIGLNALMSGQEFLHTEHIGQQTFIIFMSLIAGLIFANVALPPKKSL